MSRPRTAALALLTIAAASAALFSSPAAAQTAPNWHVNATASSFVATDVKTADIMAVDTGDNLTGFAYATRTGTVGPFDGRLAREVKYHYVGAADARFGAVAQQQLGGDYQPSTVTIGFGYKFGR